MKKILIVVIMAILCLRLAACTQNPAPGQSEQKIQTAATNKAKRTEPPRQSNKVSSRSGGDRQRAAEPPQQSPELVGAWYLDSKMNDLVEFSDSLDVFPGYGEWGARMEIRSNGQMTWYIGTEGWHGIYAVENGMIHAQLTSDSERCTRVWNFRVISRRGKTLLAMDYGSRTVYWTCEKAEE